MASNISRGRVHPDTPWHRVAIRRPVTNFDIREMIDWCKDKDHPGFFDHHFNNNMSEMVFVFTRENVAFQFKVRWG